MRLKPLHLGAAFSMGEPMCDRDCTVLPDGTVFWLDTPEDYQEAREIIHEEIGDLMSDQGWAGPVKSAAEPEYVA